MPDLKIDQQARGTRIIAGAEATRRRNMIDALVLIAINSGFGEIVLPGLEQAQLYTDKAGPEILNQMYTFQDKGDRTLCLRPEGTATCQELARTVFKHDKNLRLFYVTTCWRYEKPQAGRYREFTQFGLEVLNPTEDCRAELIDVATGMVALFTDKYDVHDSVKRGLAYYVGDGFEITCEALGAQKQVCGGGSYKEGIGFALGLDRLLLLNK